MTIDEQLRALVLRHHANLHEQIATVTRLLETRDAQGNATPCAAEAQGITHQLKGTAGSMGFPNVSVAAGALDDSLKILQREPVPAERLSILARPAGGAEPRRCVNDARDVHAL